MNRWLLLALMSFVVPLASAGPGHDGPIPVESAMYIHAADVLVLHPSAPNGSHVLTAESAPCAPQSWQMGYHNAADGTGGLELARQADLDGPVDLIWYVQWLLPNEEPVPASLPALRVDAALRSGTDLAAAGDGQELASFGGTVSPTQVAGSPGVHRLDVRLAWIGDSVLPTEGFQLELSLGLDQACATIPGVDAISRDGARPHLAWRIFDPIRIDLLSAIPVGDSVAITLHASSPWGREHLVASAPVVQGGDGIRHEADLVEDAIGTTLQQSWTWSGANGTYAVDVVVGAVDGSVQIADKALFRLGGDAPPSTTPSTTPAPAKESPGLGLVAIAAAVLVARRAQRF